MKWQYDNQFVIGYIDREVFHAITKDNGWMQIITPEGVVTNQTLNFKSYFVSAVQNAFPDVEIGVNVVKDLDVGSSIPGWSDYQLVE